MRLIALSKYYYGGRDRQIDEEFDTESDRDAEMLLLVGAARKAENEQKPKLPDHPPPLNKQMTATNDEREKAAAEREGDPVKSKRYLRRDLRSQE